MVIQTRSASEAEFGEPLYLVTTLGISAEHAAEFSQRHYDVENDIRDLKGRLSLENLRCQNGRPATIIH